MLRQGSPLWSGFILLALALITALWMLGNPAPGVSATTNHLAVHPLSTEAIAVTDTSQPAANALSHFHSLIPATWLDRTPLPTRTSREGVAPYAQSLYVVGGQGHDGTNYVQLATLQRYDV